MRRESPLPGADRSGQATGHYAEQNGEGDILWWDYVAWGVYLTHFFATFLVAAVLWLWWHSKFVRYAAMVAGDPEALRGLEAIVHPLVAASRDALMARAGPSDVVVLDVPLLFETGGHERVDAVVVASAPYEHQRRRVLDS